MNAPSQGRVLWIPPKLDPHPVFAAVWSLWYVEVLYSLWRVFQPSGWLWAVGTIVGFAVFETLALKLTWRWTLSAVVTWLVRRLSKHTHPLTGWNVIVFLVAFPIGLLVCLTWVVVLPAPWGVVAGAPTGIAVVKGLHDHWLHPELHG